MFLCCVLEDLSLEIHQEMKYPNMTLLYFATPFAFNAPDGAVTWKDLHKILHGGQRMAKTPFTHSRMRSRMIPDGWSGTIRDYSVSTV